MEEVRTFIAARGIGTSELAKGLVIHEVCSKISKNNMTISAVLQVLGAAILFSAWGGCYFARPSARYAPYQISQDLFQISWVPVSNQPFCTVVSELGEKNESWLQADDRSQNKEEHAMGESSAED